MFRTTQKNLKISWWPSPQDYNEAVQQPKSFGDDALRDGEIMVDQLGLPKPACGAFASVYRIRSDSRQHAVRCFLRNISEQEARYEMIAEFVRTDNLPYTVGFEYLRQGIRINQDWFPLLKMDWVSGLTLDNYVTLNFRNSELMAELATKFLTMCNDLKDAGIAHGDLQHGNIMISDGELRLVDYDGMFVPSMEGLQSTELGHRNYQNPSRTEDHFGPYLDNFPAWVIYASLRAIALDASLFLRFQCGDDCLIFKREDFLNPAKSLVFRTLERHENEEIRLMVRFIRAQLKIDLADVPPLQSVPPPVELDELPAPTTLVAPRSAPEFQLSTRTDDQLPAWLSQGLVLARDQQNESKLPLWMRYDGGYPTRQKGDYEPELLQSTPRPCAPRRGQINTGPATISVTVVLLLLLLVYWQQLDVVAFVVSFAIFLYGGIQVIEVERERRRELVRNGLLAHATIKDKKRLTSNYDGKEQVRYKVAYVFEIGEDESVNAMRDVPLQLFLSLEVGDTVTVLYSLAKPRKHILYEGSDYKAVLEVQNYKLRKN